MILIVCLNLAVDRTIEIDCLGLGHVHRSHSGRREAGSKGVNVARVLKTLGVPCVLTGFLGGPAGQFIGQALDKESIACAPCPIQNESRSCYILIETRTARQTVVNELGPRISPDEMERLVTTFRGLLSEAELVLFSGSLPPGVPDETYARLIALTQEGGKRALLDSSGAALRYAIDARPFLVKVNDAEGAALLGRSINDLAAAAEAGRALCSGNTSLVMITLGAKGAILTSKQEGYVFTAPDVSVKNSVGSGDAAFAGLAAGLVRGLSTHEIGVLAVAAGAANALHGGGHCTLEEITELQARVGFRRIDPNPPWQQA
jgi:tagatose 6-phosphate kinase